MAWLIFSRRFLSRRNEKMPAQDFMQLDIDARTSEATTMDFVVHRKRAPLWVHIFHRIQERIRRPKVRAALNRAICAFLPRQLTRLNEGQKRMLQSLRQDGYCLLPSVVSTSWIHNITAQIVNMPCIDPWRKQAGTFHLDHAPNETHVAQILDIVKIPAVYGLANHPEILDVVGHYLGCEPTIDSIQAWWSLPGHESPEEAENFHRDNDSIRFVKLFLYLTDVDNASGPHAFVRGSHKTNELLARSRHDDAQVLKTVGAERIVRFTGPRGLAFLEDTYGLHKGQLPLTGRRLLLQVRYSTLPTVFLSNGGVQQKDYPWKNYANRYIWRAV
ncbi:MAG: hypothetical protein E6R07_08750 [Nevskiaceae bacterium]|nr:MAG: hypothetical protein E6R07_08750 [Nevskiaceae bacterium]